MRSCYR